MFRHDSGHQPKPKVSLLDSRWELDPDSKLGTFHLRAYRPVYVLPAFYATSLNRKPSSPSPDNQVSDAIDIDRSELKFQLSFKAKLWENIFGDNGDSIHGTYALLINNYVLLISLVLAIVFSPLWEPSSPSPARAGSGGSRPARARSSA